MDQLCAVILTIALFVLALIAFFVILLTILQFVEKK